MYVACQICSIDDLFHKFDAIFLLHNAVYSVVSIAFAVFRDAIHIQDNLLTLGLTVVGIKFQIEGGDMLW